MKKLLIALLLLASVAQAETLRYCKTIESKTASGSANGSIVLFEAQNIRGLSGILTWANVAGSSPTLDAKIQSCRTTATTSCQDWMTFDQKTTSSGVQTRDVNKDTVNWFKYFRVVSTVGGSSTPTYTYTVELCYDGTN